VVAALMALGARGVLRAQREHAPRVQVAKPAAPARPVAAAPAPATEAVPDEPAPIEAEPAQAARSFALGEYERALRQYRYLAEAHPEQTAYPVMIKVLLARAR
jgi:hypothetical protein